jgi:NADPH:quinone reductase-like Zn-dependent oxidoreductase
MVNGAGGSIGTFAVQLARHFGAEVTAVDSAGKLDMLRSIGADQVIDYTREDFAKNGQTYDVIFDVVGKLSLSRSARSMRQNGTFLLANPGPSQLVGALWIRLTSDKKVVMQPSSGTTEDLVLLKELIEAGAITTVIDRRFPLAQIAEAHRYVEAGHKKGNVVITVEGNGKT